MSSPQPPQAECKWCGEKLTEGAEQCPLCRRPVAGKPRPIREPLGPPRREGAPLPSRPAPRIPLRLRKPREQEPVTPAPGQEEFGSWASIRHVMRVDKLFASLLALMALDVLANLFTGSWFSALISGAVLWGIVTFQWWGYLLAMIGAGLSLLLAVSAFIAALSQGGGSVVAFLIPFALYSFVLIILYTRRDRFD